MHIALKCLAQARQHILMISVLVAAATPTWAENAYIVQVTGRPGATNSTQSGVLSNPVPSTQFGARQTSFVPASGIAVPIRSGNFAQTIQIGNFNQVGQFQSGQGNFSNVGVLGGANNNVGVLQGGRDLSNLYLVNTQGLSIGVIQPPGSAPINMLIARLPNGSLLIKR
jgi:hypothetical protein